MERKEAENTCLSSKFGSMDNESEPSKRASAREETQICRPNEGENKKKNFFLGT
jgi:hypothetical protein